MNTCPDFPPILGYVRSISNPFIASETKKHNVGNIKGVFFLDNAAFHKIPRRFRVSFDFIHSLDKDPAFFLDNTKDFPSFSLFFAGDYDDIIVSLNSEHS
jgi:hypothetical protein